MKIKCIIIEDEPLALERTKEFVLKVPYLELIESFDNGLDAIGFLKEQNVQLIFLDIQMDEFSGIQLLESLHNKPKVIITTAF
ncbi:MAG: response regulator, partial [Draconibacterium sp.]|nr:response regulator [Draconibacterium sp.]